MSRISGTIGLACLLISFPLATRAQDAEEPQTITAEEALANAEEVWSGATDTKKADPCAEESDDPDVIIVCRRWEDGERYLFERPPGRRVGADVRVSGSGAPRPPDFNESCLHNRGRENCNMIGSVPEPAIEVDFDALPETPAGSEAARLYGGPTTDDETIEEEPEGEIDTTAQTQHGIEDEIYGP